MERGWRERIENRREKERKSFTTFVAVLQPPFLPRSRAAFGGPLRATDKSESCFFPDLDVDLYSIGADVVDIFAFVFVCACV